VSTGQVEIHPEHALGTRKPLYWWLLTSRRWMAPRPINVYVIEHERGLVVFDTGQDRASVTDDSYFPSGPTGVIYDRLARFRIGPDESLDAQLGTLGYSGADVDTAIVSHLHQDHIGGLGALSRARLLVARREWAELSRPAPEARGFLRRHIDVPGRAWELVDPDEPADASVAPFTRSLDIFGDGSLVLLPTPGHTAGSTSLLVRRRSAPPLLMVGDLTYGADLLERGVLPGVGERSGLAASTAAVRELGRSLPGLLVLPAHDPTASARLWAATAQDGAR
jgi:glyoxylase-like metal-dependent hydrolase (beta-lactamase superfamily II)